MKPFWRPILAGSKNLKVARLPRKTTRAVVDKPPTLSHRTRASISNLPNRSQAIGASGQKPNRGGATLGAHHFRNLDFSRHALSLAHRVIWASTSGRQLKSARYHSSSTRSVLASYLCSNLSLPSCCQEAGRPRKATKTAPNLALHNPKQLCTLPRKHSARPYLECPVFAN